MTDQNELIDMDFASGIAAFEAKNFSDRKSTRLNSSHLGISYAVFCLKKKKKKQNKTKTEKQKNKERIYEQVTFTKSIQR